jgi:hypothetical protein
VEIVLTYNSTKSALESEEKLLKEGFKVKVMARPVSLGANCGFCLRIESNEIDKAIIFLSKQGLKPEGLYYKDSKNNDSKDKYLPYKLVF